MMDTIGTRTMSDFRFPQAEIEIPGKLETLGQITAGVIHDFNNILGAVMGMAELIVHDLESDQAQNSPGLRTPEVIEYARQILIAGSMGQSTIKDLQAMIRPGKEQSEKIEMNKLIAQSSTLFAGSLSRTISMNTELDARDSHVLGFTGALQNSIFNLLLNARDALPNGGKITIRTSNEERKDSLSGRHHKFLLISVMDSGLGIPKEIQKQIFDPFFTTKGKKGNGMGLTNVLSTIEAMEGTISVFSRENVGTEFCIRMPTIKTENT